MSYDLIFLLEEISIKIVLEKILPKLIPEEVSYKKQNKRKFRDPDRLNSAKQELKNLVSEYYEGTHSKKIAPYLSLADNKSHSFKVLLDGIRKLL
ncbi:MAG: hypothetical protein F6K47_00665 [Symploca sp. SIO2E6]|nr:hypothetical protein [Symploca sp. SIO2E6]